MPAAQQWRCWVLWKAIVRVIGAQVREAPGMLQVSTKYNPGESAVSWLAEWLTSEIDSVEIQAGKRAK